MATGYTKQSTYETGNVISASLFNNDFNALETAFDVTDGHNHDGTVGGGAAISKIGDADFNNKIEIDSSNNIIKMFVEISTASTEVLNVTGTSLKPLTSSYDLGTSDNRFDTVYSKTINVDSSDNIAQIKLSGSGGTTIFQTVSGGTARLVADALGEQTEASRTLTFNLYDTEKMRIDNTGVGIGTDSPVSTLDVRGDISVGGSGASASQLGVLRSWSNTADADIYALMPTSSTTSGTIIEGRPNAHVVIGLRDNDNQDSFNVIGTDATYSDSGSEADNAYDRNLLCVRSTGNVGIGTNNPQSSLDVRGSSIKLTGANPLFYLIDSTNTNTCSLQNTDGNLKFSADSNSEQSSSKHTFFIDGTERMRIDSSGKVGIGTDSPDSKLDVAGEIRADNVIRVQGSGDGRVEVGGATGGYVDLKTPDTDDYDFRLAHTAANGSKLVSPNSDIKISVGNQDRLTIKTDGKVGIGTNSPDAKLHVQGGDIKITSDSDTEANEDGLPSIVFTEFNDDHSQYSADAAHAVIVYNGGGQTGDDNYLGFGVFDQTVGTENTVAEAKLLTDLNITRDGFIGIGTTEPNAKLHLMAPDCDIVQEMASDSTARLIEHRFAVDGVMQSQLGHYMGIEASEGVDAVDPRFEFRSKHDYWFMGGPTGSAPKVAFTNDGKVGIGTTSPAEILDIENTDLANSVTLKVKNLAEATDDTTLPSSELKVEADGVTGTITVEGVGSSDSSLGKVSINGTVGKPLTFGTGVNEHARFDSGHFLMGHEAIGTAQTEQGIVLSSGGKGYFTTTSTADDAVLQVTRSDVDSGQEYISFDYQDTTNNLSGSLGALQVYATDGLALKTQNEARLASATSSVSLSSNDAELILSNHFVPHTGDDGAINLGSDTNRFNELHLAGDIDLSSDSTSADTQSITFKNADSRKAYIRADYSSDASGNGTGLTIATNPNNGTSVERLKISEDGDITFFAEDGTTSGVFWDASEETLGIGDYTLTGTDGTSGQALITDGSGNVAFGDIILDVSGKADLTGDTFTGDVLFNDGVKAKFGTDSDLAIYHTDGGNSVIEETGEGALVLQTNGSAFAVISDDNEYMINATVDGGVALYNDGETRLTTSSNTVQVASSINFVVDTDTLYVDSTNDRVGINDPTPSEALDVDGNIKASGTLATGGYTLSSTDGTSGQALVTDGSGNVSFVTVDVLGKADLSGADFTGDITVDTDTLAVDISENKVGINTAIADLETELHVTASRDGRVLTGAGAVATYMLNTSARPGLTLENTVSDISQNEVGLTLKRSGGTAAAVAGIFLEKNTSDYTSGGSLNFYLPRSNVADHVITMSSHGRLGIGETDPQYPLHVKNVLLNNSDATKIAITPNNSATPELGIIGFETADSNFSNFRAEIVAETVNSANTGKSAFKFNVATTTNQASPATALTISDDIELTPTNDVILRPEDGIVMRPQGIEGVEMHWYQQTAGTTVADDGEQTKRFHITSRGIHVGDDVTGTYTAGDLQDNQDIDFGMLIGRDSDNLGSNNVGIGYQLDFDIDSASNWATGSQITFTGDTANSVGHGGNLVIGPKFNDTTDEVGVEHTYVGGYLVSAKNDYSFNWAKGNSDNNGVYRASNDGYGCIMMGEEIQIASTCSWSFAGGGIDSNGGTYTKLELDNTDYGFVYGRGHVVSNSDYAMVAGRRNDLGYAASSLVAGSNHNVGGPTFADNAANSFVTGSSNDVNGSYALACGKNNTINNTYGAAIGQSNLVEGDHAFTAGKSNNPLGNGAVCLGQGLKTPLFQQLNADNSLSSNYLWDNFVTTVGAYNDDDKKFFTDYPTDSSNPTSWVTNHRFVVGTGTIETVNNEEVITKSTGFVVANEVVDGTDGFCGIIMPALAKSNSNYATEQAAKDAGVPVGGLYHTNGVIKIVQES